MSSKIDSVEVHNFMSYQYAKATFDESGVLNIKGYNSTGKSAFLTAVGVCLMDLYKGKQGKFIRHGEDYFRVVVNFTDGVSIVKDKYINGQSLYEMYKDGEVFFSTKVGSRLTRVSEVPTPIKSYLDLIQTDQGYLNFQSRRDPLWLVETKGSENYASLNEVLKTEEISRANSMLNADINALNTEIANMQAEKQRKELQLESCVMVSQELVDALSTKDKENQSLQERQKKVLSIAREEEDLKGITIPSEVDKISTDRLAEVTKLIKNLEDLKSIKVSCEVTKIENTDRLAEVERLYKLIKSDGWEVPKGSEIDPIKTDAQSALSKVFQSFREYVKIYSELGNLNRERKKLEEERDKFMESAKAQGKVFVTCENCGTLLEVSVN